MFYRLGPPGLSLEIADSDILTGEESVRHAKPKGGQASRPCAVCSGGADECEEVDKSPHGWDGHASILARCKIQFQRNIVIITISLRLWTFEGAHVGTRLAHHRKTCNRGRGTRATFHKFQKQPASGIMLHRQNAAQGTCSAYPAGPRSETDT